MSFPRYSEYKESRIPWVARIPTAWKVEPLLAVAAERNQSNEGMVEDNLLSLSYGRIIPKDIESTDGLLPESFETYQIVEPDDIVFRLTDLQNDKRSLRTAIVRERGIITSAYLAVRPSRIFPQYLHYSLRACDVQKVFYSMGGGLRQSLKYSDIKRFPLVIPPYGEQKAIVQFLDRETAKIDALIAEQEQLIALLKEKRQAVISYSVTKGLNPDAPMKDSGVDWLGKVPVHWKVGKCGFYMSVLTGFAFQSSGFTEDESATRLLRGVNVGVGRLKWDEVVYWQRTPEDGLSDYEMKAGDIVIGMDRPLIADGMRVAKVAESDLPCLLLQRVASLKIGPYLNADFLMYLLSSGMFVAHFSPETTGVSVPHISPDQIENFIVPIPPLQEQQLIASEVLKQTTRFDSLISEAEEATALLQERRAAIISAAVTGKIDVRGIK